MAEALSPERVRELLDYDPETGIFTWLERAIREGCIRPDKGWNTRFAGKRAVGRPHRHGAMYLNIAVAPYVNKNYAMHRLAWAHFYGEWPSGAIDHINRDPADNRIANLRLATQTQNLGNTKLRSDNTSGVKGVYWDKKSKKWAAFITRDGKVTPLGRFADKSVAIAVRQRVALEVFGEFANETIL